MQGVEDRILLRVDEARQEATRFRSALGSVPADAYWGSNSAAAVLAVGLPYLDGEIAYRDGRTDEAIRLLGQAVAQEDELKYDEPPPWTVPSRHALAAVQLAAGRPAEAEKTYLADLARYPENGWSLGGLARALEAQGRKDEAAGVRERLARAWARADVRPETSCLCVKPSGR